tara:strand:- start:178 stop:696 length:519 start_codon:yes stop_codon:yes gene_type:complete
MGSTLTVDNIVGATAAANVKLPAGTILQTVTAETGGYVTHNTSTFADTGLQCSITPKYASSHILVVVSCQASQSGANGQETSCRVLRVSGSAMIGAEGQRFVYGRIEDGSSNMHTGGMQTLIRKDTSHNSTSSQTYKFQHRIISGGGVVRNNDYTTGTPPTQSTMMLMEISQ